jgi:MFS family permease
LRPAAHSTSSPYGTTFWLCYLANTALTMAVSVLYRYADFVTELGGTELQLGWIVGIGMCGALLARWFQAAGIDRFGPRRVWMASLLLYVAATLGHLTIHHLDSPAVYLLRMAMMASLAGAFGASLTYVSLRATESRVAEVVGMLGTSGFLGMAVGPYLGDAIFSQAVTRNQVDQMFLVAAAAGGCAWMLVALATRSARRPRRVRRRPPIIWLIRRYHPGALLLVAAALGLGAGLPGVFLRAYTAELGIPRIGLFFLFYAMTAFFVRLATRTTAETRGLRAVTVAGLGALVLCMPSYLFVRHEWQLALPAVLGGTAHALLFPAVVGGGSLAFPRRYRGLATTLVLLMFDLGNVIGQPLVGTTVSIARQWGVPAYPVMFWLVTAIVTAVAIHYVWTGRRRRVSEPSRTPLPGLVPPLVVAESPAAPTAGAWAPSID